LEGAASEEIDKIIKASELVASEEPLAALQTIWDVLLSHLLALLLLELILSSVELPFPVLMSN
jgi:hypothetical protein